MKTGELPLYMILLR